MNKTKIINVEEITRSIVKALRKNPEKLGNDDFDLAVNIDTDEVSMHDSATCFGLCCCSEQNIKTISLVNFNGCGFVGFNDGKFGPIGDVDLWLSSRIFSKTRIMDLLDLEKTYAEESMVELEQFMVNMDCYYNSDYVGDKKASEVAINFHKKILQLKERYNRQ